MIFGSDIRVGDRIQDPQDRAVLVVTQISECKELGETLDIWFIREHDGAAVHWYCGTLCDVDLLQ